MLADLLTQEAIVQGPVDQVDRLGVAVREWREGRQGIPCRLRYANGGKVFTDHERGVVITEQVVVFEADVVITEGMRIAEVRNADQTVAATDLEVLNVYRPVGGDGTTDHLEVRCQIVRGLSSV